MGKVDDKVVSKNELKQHSHYMKKMKETDPEFYAFLKKNDPDLLDFGGDEDGASEPDDSMNADADDDDVDGGDDDDDGFDDGEADSGPEDDDDDDMDDDDGEENFKEKKIAKKVRERQTRSKRQDDDDDDDDGGDMDDDDDGMLDSEKDQGPVAEVERPVLPLSTFENWEKQLIDTPTPQTIRKIILAFRAACDMSLGKAKDDPKSKNNKKKSKDQKKNKKSKKEPEVEAETHNKRNTRPPPPIQVTDSKVFVAVWHCCTTYLPDVFDQFLGVDTSASNAEQLPASSPKWKLAVHLNKRYLTSLTDFLSDMDVNESDMQCYVLRHVARMAPYYVSHASVAKRAVKALLRLWGSGLSEECRITSFLAMRRLCICCPMPLLELCLKGMYLTLARVTKTMTTRTMGIVKIMRNSIVEICGIDSVFAYVHAFTYLRQLAIHLRNGLAVKTKDSYKLVYNWSFIACLEVWVSVVCAYPNDPELSALLYPVSQILLGTVRVLPIPRYFPLRLHCCRMMTALSISTKKFIPITPVLLEIFETSDLHKKAVGKKTAPFEFRINLKVAKSTLQCPSFQEGLVSEVLFFLLEFFASCASSISFPELVLPTILSLRKHTKDTQVSRFRRQMQTLIDQLREHSNWIESQREKMDIGPAKLEQCLDFLAGDQAKVASSPLIKYYTSVKKSRDRDLEALDKARGNKVVGEDADSDGSDGPEIPVERLQGKLKKQNAKANAQPQAKKSAAAANDNKKKGKESKQVYENPDVVQDLDLDGF